MQVIRRCLVVSLAISSLLAIGCDKESNAPEAASEAPSASVDETARPEPGREPADESEPDGPPKTLDDLPEGVNAVQYEMRVLNPAMQEILTLIANDKLEGIPAQIKTVHPARQLTMKAVEQGQYEPPVNADKMGEFEELDNDFHDDLKSLVAAAKKDDLEAATDSYANLVQGCTNCHTRFRFERGGGPEPGDTE
jgi:hypothetical protein